ncbi:33 kDa inner dynein arm light chain, axonemal [Halyomorpha halys]|uniref:33 kDa inner dynein arm light chain, axonemal n=1 Tax=Halyomorpha halys TaxID=286706 RepID=UPI000D0C85EE|nr:33 kDa inner dynein arm light chain, axonemal-like [Halyomorpha halys]
MCDPAKNDLDWKNVSLVKWGNPCIANEEKSKEDVKGDREKILDKICPPLEWYGDGQFWIKRLSSIPVNRLDVIKLSEELDLVLNEHQIRDTGICDVRQHIYKELFNELTRQITLFCAKQGSLLVRIRDEIWMMQDFYKKMYENTLAFIYRKTVETIESREELNYLLKELKEKRNKKLKEITDLKEITKKKEEAMAVSKKNAEGPHQEEIQRLENLKLDMKKQLQKQLEAAVTTKAK